MHKGKEKVQTGSLHNANSLYHSAHEKTKTKSMASWANRAVARAAQGLIRPKKVAEDAQRGSKLSITSNGRMKFQTVREGKQSSIGSEFDR